MKLAILSGRIPVCSYKKKPNVMRIYFTLLLALACLAGKAQNVSDFYEKNTVLNYSDGDKAAGEIPQPEQFDPDFHIYLCFDPPHTWMAALGHTFTQQPQTTQVSPSTKALRFFLIIVSIPYLSDFVLLL